MATLGERPHQANGQTPPAERQKRTFTPSAAMHRHTARPTDRRAVTRGLLCGPRREGLLIIARRPAAMRGHLIGAGQDAERPDLGIARALRVDCVRRLAAAIRAPQPG